MTDKELRKLNRTELLELLVEQSKEVERLNGLLEEANEKLNSRKLDIENAGSIADAALQISGIFETAQKAADQYLDNVRELTDKQSDICARMEEESRKKAEQIIDEANKTCLRMESDTKVKCDRMVRQAEAESSEYWDKISSKLALFMETHKDIRELLTTTNIKF